MEVIDEIPLPISRVVPGAVGVLRVAGRSSCYVHATSRYLASEKSTAAVARSAARYALALTTPAGSSGFGVYRATRRARRGFDVPVV